MDLTDLYEITSGWNCGGEDFGVDKLSHGDGLSFYRTSHRSWNDAEYRTLLVSSPNSPWCPNLKSPDSPAKLRYDGTLGQDDPVCWPQPHCPDAPHLPCIPVSDPDPDSLVYLFRRGLRKGQAMFEDEWEGSLRIAKISDELQQALKSGIGRFQREVVGFFVTIEGSHPRLRYLVENLKIASSKLQRLRETLPRLRLMFGLTARFYLEAHGYIAYYTKYLPFLDSHGPASVDSSAIGVWVDNERTCIQHHRMGIPVWWIRYHVSETDKFIEYTKPHPYRLRPICPPDSFRNDGVVRWECAIVEKQKDTGTLINAIDSWANDKLRQGFRGNVEERIAKEDGEILKPMGHIQINKNIEKKGTRNAEVLRRFEPRQSRIWMEVARVYSVPLEGDQHQPRFAPTADHILGVNSPGRAKDFVAVWRLVRLHWLLQIHADMEPPPFATHRAWKSFAHNVFSNSDFKPGNPATIARIQFTEYLGFGKLVAVARDNFYIYQGETPGTVEEKITDEMVRETVRELTDINFFYDMFEVEARLTCDAPMEIEDRMWPARKPFGLTHPQKIPRSTLEERAAWITAVRDFIRGWNGSKSPHFELDLTTSLTPANVEALETAVAHVYCSNVTYLLRRRPIIPYYE